MVGEGIDTMKIHKSPCQGLPCVAVGWYHVAHSDEGFRKKAPSPSVEHHHLSCGSLHWGPALCGDSGRGVQTPQVPSKVLHVS